MGGRVGGWEGVGTNRKGRTHTRNAPVRLEHLADIISSFEVTAAPSIVARHHQIHHHPIINLRCAIRRTGPRATTSSATTAPVLPAAPPRVSTAAAPEFPIAIVLP